MRSLKWLIIFSSLLLGLGTGLVALVTMSAVNDQFPVRYEVLSLSILVSICVMVLICLILSLLLLRRVYHFVRSREQNLHFIQSFIDALPLPVYFKDTEGHYIGSNSQFCSFTGVTREALVGKRPHDVFSERTAAELASLDRKLMLGGVGSSQTMELKLLRADGEERDVLLFKARVEGDEAKATGIVGCILDVTEEKRATGLLRASEQKYRELVENTNSIILRMDRYGRITFMNEYAQKLFGYTLEQIAGKSVIGIVFPERETGGRDNLALLESLRRTPEGYPLVESEGATKDGRKVWISWANSGYCDSDGRLVEILMVGQDITERKRLHEVMIFSEKMMTMGGLAAGMAHELNNPIGGILQNAQNLSRRLSPELPANRTAAEEVGIDLESLQNYLKRRGIHDILSYIVTSCERSADIVSRMLSFSRRGGGETAPVRLSELIERTIELASCDYDLKKSYNFRSIPVVREYTEGLPPVSVNPMEIEQVLLNLLKNAAQAISELPDNPGSHRIVIRTYRLPAFAAIDIEDDGPGIPSELHSRIFEPFFTTKEVGVGTGLGLSVSYSIIADNHGSITLDTTYTGGARFTVRLPFAAPRAD